MPVECGTLTLDPRYNDSRIMTAPPSAAARSGRVLEPMDRILEVLCGLIMVLTFTLAASLSGHADVRTMLIAALGCNLAWGIVDAVMYLMTDVSRRARDHRTIRKVKQAADADTARDVISEALPPALASALKLEDLDALRNALDQLPEPPEHPPLTPRTWLKAFAIFLLVFLSTFPVVIPFAVLHDFRVARHISNFIAIVMLFAAGYSYGRHAGFHPARMGFSMVLLGGALVGVTIAFGG